MRINGTDLRVAWSLAEVAKVTGLSVGFIRAEIKRGVLPVKRFGRRVLVLDSDLKSYLHRDTAHVGDERHTAR